MTHCRKCNNRNFQPTIDAPRCVENLGGKRYFMTSERLEVATRRYLCHNCGHRWLTHEIYERPLYKQATMFEEETAHAS